MQQSFQILSTVSDVSSNAMPTILTSLRNSDHVVPSQNGWDTIRLDRSWSTILAQLDILKHDRVQTSIFKLCQ